MWGDVKEKGEEIADDVKDKAEDVLDQTGIVRARPRPRAPLGGSHRLTGRARPAPDAARLPGVADGRDGLEVENVEQAP